MKKQASILLPALLDLLRQYLALDMAVYAGHATLLLLTAALPLLMWVLVIINMLPFYSVSDIAALVAQLLPDIPTIQSMAVDVIANLNDQVHLLHGFLCRHHHGDFRFRWDGRGAKGAAKADPRCPQNNV